jgi:hypothetical protein
VVADVLSRKSRDGKTDPKVHMEQLAKQFAILQIGELLTGGPPIILDEFHQI